MFNYYSCCWFKIKSQNKNAKLALIDIVPNSSTQVHDDKNVLNVGGFSDSVFEIISLVEQDLFFEIPGFP